MAQIAESTSNSNYIQVVSLKNIVDLFGEEKFHELTATFSCERNEDIERFLKNYALEFEKLDKSRTFILVDDEGNVLAYFTVALSVFQIPASFSNRKIKNLDGFSSKNKSEVLTSLPAILIGQLGKNDSFAHKITGELLMDFCISIILEGQELLGGRILLLECKNKPKLKEFYGRYGFTEVEFIDDEPVTEEDAENKMIQMIKVLSTT